jgi:hypothetical protein
MSRNPENSDMSESLDSSPDDSAGNGDKANVGAAKSQDRNLPMVVAPKLGAGEDEEMDEAAGEAADETVAPAARANSRHFMILAASVAFAATFGSLVGSVSGSGLARFLYPATPSSGEEEFGATIQAMKAQFAELSAIKGNLDNAARNTNNQFAKIADRLDRLDQRTAAAAASETTGSISTTSNAPPPTEPPKLTDRILADWVVQDVQNGRALVESRYGGVFDVGAGSNLPGVGSVETIKREGGQWVVVTARGLITSGR